MRLSTPGKRQVSPGRRRISPTSRSFVPIRCCSSHCSRCPTAFGVADVVGRILAAAFGVGTLVIAYHLGSLYGRRAGIVSMALLALMPYHVTVSRQVLLDAPMVFFATAALYALVRYCSHAWRAMADRNWCADGPGNPDQGDRRRPLWRHLLLLRTQPDCQAPLQALGAGPCGGGCDRRCFPLTLASRRRHAQRRQLPGLAVVSAAPTIPSTST